MKRRIFLAASLFIILVVFAVVYLGGNRRIDGRTAAQWLIFAERASRTVSYQAEGTVFANRTRAQFQLNQGTGGRYIMTTRDSRGRTASLGFDGKQVWSACGTQRTSIQGEPTPTLPKHARARILGTRRIAHRAGVRIVVFSGTVQKVVTIDRKTGVVLAMTTHAQHRLVSSMSIRRITFQPVTVRTCSQLNGNVVREVSIADAERHVGKHLLQPNWLPAGYTHTSTLLQKCQECSGDMALLRYSDGIGAVTLFEMPGHATCMMGPGCYATPQRDAVVETRIIHGVSVTAIGNISQQNLSKILNGLR